MSSILKIRNKSGEWVEVPAIIGSSAYEVAIKNGFQGTEEEWLETLSPDVEVAETDGGHIVEITDSRGSRQFLVQDGKTKMSELEQDLQSLVFGNTAIDGNGITKSESGGKFDLLVYHLRLHGYDVTIDASDGVSIKNLKPPTNDKDAANKKYVDDTKPEKLSELENDCGYITEEDIPDVDVPTKMSELEQDLASLKVGGYTISAAGISAYSVTFRTDMATNIYSQNSVTIKGKYQTVVQNLVYPENDKDAANKKYVDEVYDYVDDITGDISTALDGIIALQNTLIGGETV